ncbi:MAG: hypothetical protein HY272_01955 [Gammaproteobacteria bacterium]|nr:hypothetical protein [Gammaproteobacteria bacterium]
MRNEKMQAQITEQRFELVKFDGEPPAPGEVKEPAEIIEGGDGIETAITYRKGEGDTLKLFTGDGNGYAILAKEEPRV